jgi:hypothetical protein
LSHQSGRHVVLELDIQGADPREADELSLTLLRDIEQLDIQRAERLLQSPQPGTKGDIASIGDLLIVLGNSAVLASLVGLARDWVNRGAGRKIKVIDGDRSIELTGGSQANENKLVQQFISGG